MEGTKYTQHKLTDNITCMIILSHIRQCYARLPDLSYTSCREGV